MTDEAHNQVPPQPQPPTPAPRADRYPRYDQRNLAGRLFPGPSKEMSRQEAQRIQGLLQPLDQEAIEKLKDQRRAERRAGLPRGSNAPSSPPVNVATSEDIDKLHGSIEEQNELLRAILASSVDTQEDARSTAQNSRTFAWAGTAIALLTLVATVVALVAAIRG